MADRELVINTTIPEQSTFMIKRGMVLVIGDVDDEFVAKAIAEYTDNQKRRVKVLPLRMKQ